MNWFSFQRAGHQRPDGLWYDLHTTGCVGGIGKLMFSLSWRDVDHDDKLMFPHLVVHWDSQRTLLNTPRFGRS